MVYKSGENVGGEEVEENEEGPNLEEKDSPVHHYDSNNESAAKIWNYIYIYIYIYGRFFGIFMYIYWGGEKRG